MLRRNCVGSMCYGVIVSEACVTGDRYKLAEDFLFSVSLFLSFFVQRLVSIPVPTSQLSKLLPSKWPSLFNIQSQTLQLLVNTQSTLSAAANSPQKRIGLPYSSVLAPGPVLAPDCIQCTRPTSLLYTRTSNRKGNAGRPYYKCVPCDKFHCFADQRGNDPTNTPCDCGKSSKRQISGPEKGRQVHYVCRIGGCDFYKAHKNTQQETINLDKELVEPTARLSII